MVEHHVRNVGVESSNLFFSTIEIDVDRIYVRGCMASFQNIFICIFLAILV